MSPRRGEEDFILMFIDITRVHPHCEMRRKVRVTLPQEDPHRTNPELRARLLRPVYSLREAGRNFELFTYTTMKLGG
eukprot:1955309-Prorocentrum_lima.AAC.1